MVMGTQDQASTPAGLGLPPGASGDDLARRAAPEQGQHWGLSGQQG